MSGTFLGELCEESGRSSLGELTTYHCITLLGTQARRDIEGSNGFIYITSSQFESATIEAPLRAGGVGHHGGHATIKFVSWIPRGAEACVAIWDDKYKSELDRECVQVS